PVRVVDKHTAIRRSGYARQLVGAVGKNGLQFGRGSGGSFGRIGGGLLGGGVVGAAGCGQQGQSRHGRNGATITRLAKIGEAGYAAGRQQIGVGAGRAGGQFAHRAGDIEQYPVPPAAAGGRGGAGHEVAGARIPVRALKLINVAPNEFDNAFVVLQQPANQGEAVVAGVFLLRQVREEQEAFQRSRRIVAQLPDALGHIVGPVGGLLHVVFGYLNEGRWQVAQRLDGGVQRRGVNLRALSRVGDVHVVHPLHQRGSQEPVLAIELVGFRFEVGIHDGPHQDLQLDVRAALGLGLQRGDGRHVAAYAVAHYGQVGAIHVDFSPVFRYPFRGRVDFVDGLRKLRVWRRRVVDEYRREA
nr:hypothetical protein [Tanacetum cinerariifolium]